MTDVKDWISNRLYDMRVFETRQEARDWLVRNYYDPAPVTERGYGLWFNAHGKYVQAFRNLCGSWTVQDYKHPDASQYIMD